MSEILSTLFSIIIILALTIGPLLLEIQSRRVIKNTYDKSIIYLASELSFTPDKWLKIKEKIDYNSPKNIPIPFKTIAVGMYGHPLSAFLQIGVIWYGLLFLAALSMFAVINTPFKLFASDVMATTMVLGLGLCWFIYNFKSFSAEVGQTSEKSDIALSFLIGLGWENINEEVIDILEKEVRVDFELYKKETSINGVFLFLSSGVFLFYSKISGLVSFSSALIFIFIFVSVFISKWLYETHRSRLIVIALNTILALKKNKKLNLLESV